MGSRVLVAIAFFIAKANGQWGVPCNYSIFEDVGCDSALGLQCDTTEGELRETCVCKNHHVKFNYGLCLPTLQINDNCYYSAQCTHIPNASCLSAGYEYDLRNVRWRQPVSSFLTGFRFDETLNKSRNIYDYAPAPGKCSCYPGWYYDTSGAKGVCIEKVVGSRCKNDSRCRLENAICWISTCECRPGFVYEAQSDSCVTPRTWAERYRPYLLPAGPAFVVAQWKRVMIVCELLLFVLMLIVAIIYVKEKSVMSAFPGSNSQRIQPPTTEAPHLPSQSTSEARLAPRSHLSFVSQTHSHSPSHPQSPVANASSHVWLGVSPDDDPPPAYHEIFHESPSGKGELPTFEEALNKTFVV